jgi:hypothetical protein
VTAAEMRSAAAAEESPGLCGWPDGRTGRRGRAGGRAGRRAGGQPQRGRAWGRAGGRAGQRAGQRYGGKAEQAGRLRACGQADSFLRYRYCLYLVGQTSAARHERAGSTAYSIESLDGLRSNQVMKEALPTQ